ncbi:MAG: hypothetical protein KDB03_00495 [Planctomycetales bacterium]|nr:hypothetical protein [Planctomycetales bacterium]
MWNTIFGSSTLPALEQSAIFAQKRHMLLASNLANLDTPDYQTRDLSVTDFQAALKEAIEQPSTSRYANHSDGLAGQQPALDKVRDVSKQILFHDGSDVSLEEQVTQISKNQFMHQMAVTLMRSQYQNMLVAIRESPSV